MSYEIIYNSVFLKSSAGITPCILSGSNNCYDDDNCGLAECLVALTGKHHGESPQYDRRDLSGALEE